MTSRRRKPAKPENQYVTTTRWAIARYPGIAHAYVVLYRGQHVGWIIPTEQGWWWRTDDNLATKPRFSASAYRTPALAGAALTSTGHAIRISGGVRARAADFRAVTDQPWHPTVEPR